MSAPPAEQTPEPAATAVRPGDVEAESGVSGPPNRARTTPRPLPRHVPVLIVGTGFGGLAVSHGLSEAGIEHWLIERAADVGGTWRDNRYPGCACDIPSRLYSLSFAPNPDWTRLYPSQPEIERYLHGVAADLGVDERTSFETELTSADFDATQGIWRISTSRGELTADVLVSATGGLSYPRAPEVSGLGSFPGPVMHTAAWRPEVELAGKRVAVVGTGASAIQVIPEVAKVAAEVLVFQRTPAWVLPREDRAVGERERRRMREHPEAQRLARGAEYLTREVQVFAMAHAGRLLRVAERRARRVMAEQVPDPELRRRLTPTYRLGCKRVLLSDDYYPAMSAPHVRLADGLEAVNGSTLVDAAGREFEADVIILATGFDVVPPPVAKAVRGLREGLTLADQWTSAALPGAYKGTTTPGFPNLFWILGPNTGLGGNSVVYMIEAQVPYVVGGVKAALERGPMSVRRDVQRAYQARIQHQMRTTVWATGGCTSWYLDDRGQVAALWPRATWRFRNELRSFDADAYEPVVTAPRDTTNPISPPEASGMLGSTTETA